MLLTDVTEFNYLGFDRVSGIGCRIWPDGID